MKKYMPCVFKALDFCSYVSLMAVNIMNATKNFFKNS